MLWALSGYLLLGLLLAEWVISRPQISTYPYPPWRAWLILLVFWPIITVLVIRRLREEAS